MQSSEVSGFLNQMINEYEEVEKKYHIGTNTTLACLHIRDFINKQDIPERLVEFFYEKEKDETMKCKYCGSTASFNNKFHNVECCVRCYKKGLDK